MFELRLLNAWRSIESDKRINLLYDDVERNYHVITTYWDNG